MNDMPNPPFARFRKKPVVVSAIQWTGENLQSVDAFFGDGFGDWQLFNVESDNPAIGIMTLEGSMRAGVGDWIIRGVQGEFYPCKPDIFEATYDPVLADGTAGTRVTATDLATGEEETDEIVDDFVLVTNGRCYLAHTVAYISTGTTVLTIKTEKVLPTSTNGAR